MGQLCAPLVSPFLLNPSLLLQMMTGASSSLSSAPASPPQTPVSSGSAAGDKTELLRVNSESLGQYALFRQNMLRQLADKKTLSRRDSSDSNETGPGGHPGVLRPIGVPGGTLTFEGAPTRPQGQPRP